MSPKFQRARVGSGVAPNEDEGEGAARAGGVTVVRGDGVDRGAHAEIKIASVRRSRFIFFTIND